MKNYVCTLTINFECDDEDEARALFAEYLLSTKGWDEAIEIEEAP